VLTTVRCVRILFLNADYPSFLGTLYEGQRGLPMRQYAVQLAVRNASCFGTADFMSRYMARSGVDSIDVHANNRPLQEAWLASRRLNISGWIARALTAYGFGRLRRRFVTFDRRHPRFKAVLAEQIAAFRPSVLYNHDPGGISADWLKSMLPSACALVAQIASPRDPSVNWHAYDLVISSLPNFVAAFRREGVAAEYMPLAFEPAVLRSLGPVPRDVPLSFVGSLSPAHGERLRFLETLAARSGVAIWGDGADRLTRESALRARHRGAAWGTQMFRVLARSEVTLNKHIDISENYANNMRLFEATGMGACLITDWKENLQEMFEPGKEVVAYRTIEECLDLIRYYSTNTSEREGIARAGQARCLRDHSYERRMAELVALLKRRFD
jgi:spore maturation protein CgeB